MFQLPCFGFCLHFGCSCPHAVLQFPWPLGCKFFNCLVTASLAFGLSVLQLPSYRVIDFGVVSSSIALWRLPWPLGCQFFNCLVTVFLTLGLSVLQFLVSSVLDLWVVVLQWPCDKFLDPFGVRSSVASLQCLQHLVWKFFNWLATIILTFWV